MTKDELAEVYLRGAGYYRKLAYRYLRGFPNADELTRDVVQDAFLEACEKLDKYDPMRSSPFTWISRFVQWGARHMRTKVLIEAHMLTPLTEVTQSHLPVVESVEPSLAVERLLSALPPTRRRVISRVVLDERQYQEVANEEGVSRQTVHEKVQRGLAKLKRMLEQKKLTLPPDKDRKK